MRIPAKLAIDLYVKAILVKLNELEDRVKALEKQQARGVVDGEKVS